jgi:signal peptidase I
MKLFLGILSLLVLFAGACSALRHAAVQPVKVEGTAMMPALNDGDGIFISRTFEKLERGDIVVFYYPPEPSKSYIKRIVGLPNEEVEIADGKVTINGKVLEEPYVGPESSLSARASKKVTVPENNFFVMGDNRDNSNDSRIWGPLAREFIYGKFVSKYYAAKS